MKLFEIYEKTPHNAMNDFFDQQEEIERNYNIEAYRAQQKQREYYDERGMGTGDSVPVFSKAATQSEEETWTNEPDEAREASAGFQGLQNVKRRAGHPDFDQEAVHKDPHSDPIISTSDKKMIDDALKSLGRK